MVKTTAILREELNNYINPTVKIRQLVKKGELIRIVRGLYETDSSVQGYYLAPVIYGPSYLSFEFALAYHSLIPEAVYNYTSATYEKKKAKRYDTPFGTFTYSDIPGNAYPVGVNLYKENGYGFWVASAEKAVCDELYRISPLNNRSELLILLFEDIRIDEEVFGELDLEELYNISARYKTQNHGLLQSYLRRML